MIFASPDFGASGSVVLMLLAAWLLLAGVVVGAVIAVQLLRRDSTGSKIGGALLLSACVLLPLTCCVGPPYFVRVVYGNYPLGQYPNGVVREGMTGDEVRALLGSPHERYVHDREETWFYWLDSFDIHWFGVFYGPDGRVKSTSGN